MLSTESNNKFKNLRLFFAECKDFKISKEITDKLYHKNSFF